MKNFYLGLKFSFSYFSILPISFTKEDDLSKKEVLGQMLFNLPLVGLVLGGLTILLFLVLSHLEWYGAIISAVVYMMLYGFIHTEAIMDVADAIYASHSGKDAYTIIKEPTVGAMGVLYAVGLILLKIAGAVYLLIHGFLMEFVAVLMVSRLSLLMLFKIHIFRSSFASLLKESLSIKYIIGSFALFTMVGSMLMVEFILLLLVGLLFAFLISSTIKSKIGFVNGDVLGATLEGVEILLFMTLALFIPLF
ncbi:MAG TPA: adenosylcobinamide-GDP ribazoletransferase [Campylobacterales bacterium]|nr:adenosylcobinamide-GDP ribazoletransferase [Campylobacterales bacterium]HIP41957.1 adenosylcobinamide-GDP ribazoletransferase [Campylobacterales bacterium]